MKHIKTYTSVHLDPKTFETLERSLQYLEEITEELDVMKDEKKDLFALWDTSNSAYGSLWDFLTCYKDYKRLVEAN